MSAADVLVWVNCPYCHAISLGAPPHGQGQPCPMKVETEAVYVAMLEAQTIAQEAAAASHNRSGFAMNDMTQVLKRMTGQDEEDDE